MAFVWICFARVCPSLKLGSNTIHRQKRQAQVKDPQKYAPKRGLVEDRAAQQRVAVLVARDDQAVKPLGPVTVKLTLNDDLVPRVLSSRRAMGSAVHSVLLVAPGNVGLAAAWVALCTASALF
jgi:hypothetical protein